MSTNVLDELHIGDEGTVIELTLKDAGVVVDISNPVVLKMKFAKPSGATETKTAVLVTDGTDGKLKYTTEAGVSNILDEAGVWKVQAYVELSSGKWHSEAIEFEVKANLA